MRKLVQLEGAKFQGHPSLPDSDVLQTARWLKLPTYLVEGPLRFGGQPERLGYADFKISSPKGAAL